jgi:hypothetical protein
MKPQTNILITLATSASLFLLPQTGLIAQQLVAYYPFNGNALDESGNGNNGTVVGATLTTDRFGNANSCYQFVGWPTSGHDYIQVPPSQTLALGSAATFCAWVYNGASGGIYILKKRVYLVDGDYQLAGDETFVQSRITLASGQPVECRITSTGLPIGAWTHVAGVFDGQSLSTYVNGQLRGTVNTSGTIRDNGYPLYIGADYNSPGGWFNGRIDEVRIYNRALSGVQITSLVCDGSTPEWVLNPENGHSYALTCVDSSWPAAETKAESYGAHLVTIRNANENNWLFQTFGQWSRWIGLYQLANSPEPDGGWVWAIGAPVTYLNWAPGEPNNFIGVNEMFGTMYGVEGAAPGQWNDAGLENAGRLRGIMELVIDSDNDGVPDSLDLCPNTPPGAIVDVNGCSIAQLVPCHGPLSGGAWRNHGAYVSAVARKTEEFLLTRIITAEQRNAIIAEAARSTCGR